MNIAFFTCGIPYKTSSSVAISVRIVSLLFGLAPLAQYLSYITAVRCPNRVPGCLSHYLGEE